MGQSQCSKFWDILTFNSFVFQIKYWLLHFPQISFIMYLIMCKINGVPLLGQIIHFQSIFLGLFNGKTSLPSQLLCDTNLFPLPPSAWSCPDDPDRADAGVLPPQPGDERAAAEAGGAAGEVGRGGAGTWAAGSGTPPGWGWVFLDDMKKKSPFDWFLGIRKSIK